MSEQEKQAAKEIMESLRSVPEDGQTYVRGYLQGRLDGIKAERERKEQTA